MIMNELPQRWADQFGLALVPLFSTMESVIDGSHGVLLDGGYGSFAISVSSEELWRDKKPACWAWSSNLPHHVTVTDNVVAVTRCDSSRYEVFSRPSVESQIESFYEYLVKDRVQPSQRVVDYVLYLFRRIRSLVDDAELHDARSIDAFLAFLSLIIRLDQLEANGEDPTTFRNNEAGADVLHKLSKKGITSLIEEIREGASQQPFRLFPSLAVRHAGSEIFQEAHFELLRAPSLDLFSYAGPAEANSVTRGGAHFTPAALARSIVEQTLHRVEGLTDRERLIILDPACGSGSFLHEALRALRRLEFAGHIVLVGRDISSAAVSMADFVVHHAAGDWSSNCNIEIDILVADSLAEPLPHADVILMNPPFLSWQYLNDHQRDQVRQVLGSLHKGRADLSMAFVSRAVNLLAAGGALGVLFPSSLLTLQAAENWRTDLLDRTDLCLLASLGDYGLFAHALIQVSMAVMSKPRELGTRQDTTTALITTNSAEATGNALRTLRRSNWRAHSIGEDGAWRLFEMPATSFRSRPTWKLITPKAETALSRFLEAGAIRISDLFSVRQGLLTGDNKAFILDKNEFERLPPNEKEYFKPAVMNQSFQNGQLQFQYWVFYPYDIEGPLFTNENSLLEMVPEYAKRFLLPKRERLLGRKSLTRANRKDWWGLSERRSTWAFNSTPRLVSKYYGGPGGFAVDLTPSFLVVQGYVWFLRNRQLVDEMEDDDSTISVNDLLCAYLGITNSRCFNRLLELFSPHVSGGQFELSSRYVSKIPIPNLIDLARDERMGRQISKLVDLGRESRPTDVNWVDSADRITTELYGKDFFERI